MKRGQSRLIDTVFSEGFTSGRTKLSAGPSTGRISTTTGSRAGGTCASAAGGVGPFVAARGPGWIGSGAGGATSSGSVTVTEGS